MLMILLLLLLTHTVAWTPPRASSILRRQTLILRQPDHRLFQAIEDSKTKETTLEEVQVPVRLLELTEEEDAALRAVSRALSPKSVVGDAWFESPEAWHQARKEHPPLAPYSDEELKLALLRQPPKVLDVFLYTPVGPFVLLNIVIAFTGLSWCDTPFGDALACSPPLL
jgi:hypothetical protein